MAAPICSFGVLEHGGVVQAVALHITYPDPEHLTVQVQLNSSFAIKDETRARLHLKQLSQVYLFGALAAWRASNLPHKATAELIVGPEKIRCRLFIHRSGGLDIRTDEAKDAAHALQRCIAQGWKA